MDKHIANEFGIRRWYVQEDETLLNETGQAADGAPLRKLVIAACLANPCAHRQFTPDLGKTMPAPNS